MKCYLKYFSLRYGECQKELNALVMKPKIKEKSSNYPKNSYYLK